MASYAELIAALTNKVDALSTTWQAKLDSLNAARDAATSAAATVLATALNLILTSNQVSIYVHAVNGDDENAGTSTSPVRTWGGAIAKMQAGQRVEVNLMTDVVADTLVLWKNPPLAIRFVGRGDDVAGVERRKIQFVDATNFTASYVGGLYCLSSMEIDTFEVDFEMAQTRTFSPIYVRAGRLELKAVKGTISRTGTGGPLFDVAGSAHFEVTSIVIDPSASGNVISGISAGGDPNSRAGYTANFSQA